ncbi:uncharacterized protein RHIMIDRAFT_266876 [Rhizopus microsporus ATCC 52813]|uniref:Uncharacterized protein n=1 Tax=Rhizopus microsporus ATCC 52813 TaxID=1340429 RepID=A0A2G4T716_RHIZD|nr:uncharacterized protein RHIMIDRAFT_266876 [Rhizopus microsporus ATCC 52813]PHZ16815.1 hypothetical protein RHIMIDRAFT_266876 [Rhizopus microsporus ATCC 52813]
MQQDNITWIMNNTRENTDKLTELYKKYPHAIKEVYMKTFGNHETDHLLRAILSECKGLEKLTCEKIGEAFSPIESPVSNQILSSSLIALRLIVTEIQPEALSVYSYAFPELRNLIIESFYFDEIPPVFEIDMSKAKFSHLQIHLDSDLFIPDGCESEVKEVVLEITSQKSSPTRFLTNFAAPNQMKEFTANKEYGRKFVINCADIDFLSLSIDKTHVLKKCPLFL